MNIFIDRNSERKAFLNLINDFKQRSRVVLLAAASGVGKSCLIDEVIRESNYIWRYRVEISGGDAVSASTGLYFKRFVRLFSEFAKEDIGLYTFEQYIHDVDAPNSILRSGINLLFPVVGHEMRHYESVSHNVSSWLEQNDYYYELALNYIRKIIATLNGRQIIFSIENAQGIDLESTRLITKLLEISSNILLFLEYTVNGDASSQNRLESSFKEAGIDYSAYSLNKLPKMEIMKAISTNRLYDIVSDSYDKSDGNLFKLRLLWEDERYTSHNIQYEEAIKTTLAHLNDTEMIILSSLEMHQGQIDRNALDELDQIIPTMPKTGNALNDSIEYLLDAGVMLLRNGYYLLAHDSIAKEIRESVRFKKPTVIAIDAWIKYYQRLNDSLEVTIESRLGNDRQIILLALRKSDYSLFVDELNAIAESLTKYPITQLVYYLDSLLRIYNDNKRDNSWDKIIFQKCLAVYYHCGQFKYIIELADYADIGALDDISKVCFLAAVSSEDANKAEIMLQSSLALPETPKYQIIKQLLIIRIKRAKGEISKCKALWEKLKEQIEKSKTSLAADVFRYASICETKDYNLRVSNLKSAYELYRQDKRAYGEIATCLILSRDLFFLNKHGESKEWLEKAGKLLSNTLYPRYQYYNNAGLIHLFDEEYETAQNCFNRALRICTNSDDLVLIKLNKLCMHLLQNSFTEASDALFCSLSKENLYGDSVIADELLYNCYQYANTRSYKVEKEKLTKPFQRLMKDFDNPKSLNHYQRLILNQTEMKCLPIFIIDWDIDYYSVLGSLQ